MLKWLCEIVYAFAYAKHLSTSFWRALRFVRCDYLVQQEIGKLCRSEDRQERGDTND